MPLKTAFVKKTLNQDQNKINITNKCTEMLCLKEGVFNLVKETDLKPDTAGMQSMMDQMKQVCPMMGKMMSKGMMGGGMMNNDDDKGSGVKKPAENPSAQH